MSNLTAILLFLLILACSNKPPSSPHTLETSNSVSSLLSFLSFHYTQTDSHCNPQDSKEEMHQSTQTVLCLFFFLIALLVLLFLLYKKLNRETNGEYTVHRMVYKEGGVRDRMRAAVLTVEGHLGFQLWPHSDNDIENMDGEDDVERQEEDEDSQASDSGGEDDQENPENDSTDPSNTSEGKGGENSSVEDVEEGEHRRLMVAADVTNETSEDTEKKIEENKKVEGGEGTGLLIDLKQFSGSAIWSEEDVGDSKGGDLTAL